MEEHLTLPPHTHTEREGGGSRASLEFMFIAILTKERRPRLLLFIFRFCQSNKLLHRKLYSCIPPFSSHPQHRLYFLPLPHGQGVFLPILPIIRLYGVAIYFPSLRAFSLAFRYCWKCSFSLSSACLFSSFTIFLYPKVSIVLFIRQGSNPICTPLAYEEG